MESPPRKIREIMEAHNALLRAYDSVLRDVSNGRINRIFPYQIPNPYLLSKQFLGVYERLCLPGLLFSFTLRWPHEVARLALSHILPKLRRAYTFVPKVKWRRRFISFRPFLKYLIIEHIRRNYYKLYDLYLQEIVLQNIGSSSQKELDEFRTIAEDLKKHADNLPSSCKLFAAIIAILTPIAAILTASGWIFEVSGLKAQISQVIEPYVTVTAISGVVGVSIVIPVVFLLPFSEASIAKRWLFVRPSFQQYYFSRDIFLGRGSEIYQSSMYKLEDDLYASLEHTSQKPEEHAFDLLFTFALTAFALFIFIVVTYVIFAILPSNLPPTAPEYARTTLQALGYFSALSVVYFIAIGIIMPILGWRNRSNAGMT